MGHLRREVPDGYHVTLRDGKNRIRHAGLAEYGDRLCVVTRGPLFTRDRWVETWRFRTGANDPLMDSYLASLE